MSIYICEECNSSKDEDWNVCTEWGDGLICEDCLEDACKEFHDDNGFESESVAELYAWAKENF